MGTCLSNKSIRFLFLFLFYNLFILEDRKHVAYLTSVQLEYNVSRAIDRPYDTINFTFSSPSPTLASPLNHTLPNKKSTRLTPSFRIIVVEAIALHLLV